MLLGILLFPPFFERKVAFPPLYTDSPDYFCHRTRQDMVLPLGTPIRGVDGTEIKEIPITKGTKMVVNITACNNNPEIWGQDSYEWKPERWLRPLPDSVSSAHIPGVFSNLLV